MQPQTTENVKSAVAEKLVGQMSEGTAIINGCKTNALIDTGSQVTTISEDFYDQHLTDCDIVGAGGQKVPFLGYVSVNISFPEHEAGTYMRGNITFALIVPNTTYNQRVPAVIGTNVLRHYASKYDHRNKTGGAQTASSAWHRIYQAITVHENFCQRPSGQHVALTETQRKKAQTLLKDMDYVFAKSNDDLGCTAEVQHEIKLTDDQPVKQPCRRVPPAQ